MGGLVGRGGGDGAGWGVSVGGHRTMATPFFVLEGQRLPSRGFNQMKWDICNPTGQSRGDRATKGMPERATNYGQTTLMYTTLWDTLGWHRPFRAQLVGDARVGPPVWSNMQDQTLPCTPPFNFQFVAVDPIPHHCVCMVHGWTLGISNNPSLARLWSSYHHPKPAPR